MNILIAGDNLKLTNRQVEIVALNMANNLWKETPDINLEINFEPHDDVKGFDGCCWYDADDKWPYKIWVRSSRKIDTQLSTLAHEMVHVWQMHRGDINPMTTTIYNIKKYKHWQHEADDSYWDNPMEIEAFGRTPGLVARLYNTNPELKD